MPKSTRKAAPKAAAVPKTKAVKLKVAEPKLRKSAAKPKAVGAKTRKAARKLLPASLLRAGPAHVEPSVLDRLFETIASRKGVDPSVSHSARLLSRGRAKVAQKFGEEAVECLIEAVAGNKDALIAESADVLYHLLVMWVDVGVAPFEVWAELERRQGVSGIAEKAARAQKLAMSFGLGTTKIP